MPDPTWRDDGWGPFGQTEGYDESRRFFRGPLVGLLLSLPIDLLTVLVVVVHVVRSGR